MQSLMALMSVWWQDSAWLGGFYDFVCQWCLFQSRAWWLLWIGDVNDACSNPEPRGFYEYVCFNPELGGFYELVMSRCLFQSRAWWLLWIDDVMMSVSIQSQMALMNWCCLCVCFNPELGGSSELMLSRCLVKSRAWWLFLSFWCQDVCWLVAFNYELMMSRCLFQSRAFWLYEFLMSRCLFQSRAGWWLLITNWWY